MAKLKLLTGALLVCAITLAAASRAARGEEPALPELNRKVLKFTEDQQGKTVGNGECWTLAAEALASAGARRPGVNGVGPLDFGRKLEPRETILPGDVVQFEKAKFVHKTEKAESSAVLPHHTAVVAKVDGKTVTLLHQNFGGKRFVHSTVINLDERTEGTADFFRPLRTSGR
jgi:hypothetical protein